MKLESKTLQIEEPEYSKRQHQHPEWDADWRTERWSARMQCDEADCRETLVITGETEEVEYIDENEDYGGWVRKDVLRAYSAYPPPPLISISKKTPYKVREQIRLSFQSYWMDLSACASRLRTAVELMLDDQKVPREKWSQKKNKLVPADLNSRISLFEQMAGGAGVGNSLHALRNVGNLGTHGSDTVTLDALFDSMDVFEDVILGVYENKSIQAKAERLVHTKGKYT